MVGTHVSKRTARKHPDNSYSSRTVTLVNSDWDRAAAQQGDTLDAALSRHTLAATLDIKRWENEQLAKQHADLEAGGVAQWLETTKRGLGIFLQVDRNGRAIVSGVEHPSAASAAGVVIGSAVLAINGKPIPAGAENLVGLLLETLCHRTVALTLSGESIPDHHRWMAFPEFAHVSDGHALVIIEHCAHCSTNHGRGFKGDQLITTEHNEEKYITIAKELQTAIQELVGPLVPVLLKPYDPQDTRKVRARLGARDQIDDPQPCFTCDIVIRPP
eukprot:SAG31_NODE_7458_length_1683_cov_39.134680_1_plen_273_part_00